ncbi:hypothetical protein LCGC14_2517300 [marine sediment metagenome]|uniref:Uncharacterized protein n=1 Tax=marine sediment metagenome TaxID=412755 RepID=A0A0F9D934_9ZZZZ
MIRGLNGEPDDMTEEYCDWCEEKAEAMGLIPQEDTMSKSCEHKELNEHGLSISRCLRDAAFIPQVDGVSYCEGHAVKVLINKKAKEKVKEIRGGGIRIANKAHYDGWTAKLQRVWRKDGSEADITIIEDLMMPDEFTIHVRGKQYAHVEQPADMDSAIAVAELGMLAWGMGSTEATKEETVEALKGLLGVDPGKNDEEESDKVSEEEHDRMVEPAKFPECSKSDAVVDAAKNIVIKAAMECADEIGEDNRKLSTYGNLRDALNILKKVWV